VKRIKEDHQVSYKYVIPHLYTRATVHIAGLGTYAPGGVITSEFFAHIATQEGSPRRAEDLERVTGLRTRHVRASTLELCRRVAGPQAPGLIDDPASPRDESLVDMAVIAAQRALASAERCASELDTIVAVSASDNGAFPTIASQVQLRLETGPIRSIMLHGACASQTEAFQVSAEALMAGSARLVLLVTTDAMLSNILNVLDWKTSSLFGEGAAAFLLEYNDDVSYLISGSDAHQGPALCYRPPFRKEAREMLAGDRRMEQLYRERRGAELTEMFPQQNIGYMMMNGKEIFREAPRAMAECVDVLRRHARLSHEKLAHIVPHQANSRITSRLGELLVNEYGWPDATKTRLVDNFRAYGNLSNASIGFALVELLSQDRLHDGEWLALPAVGGGMNYGCWLLRYHALKCPQAAFAAHDSHLAYRRVHREFEPMELLEKTLAHGD
jgi:3-oxoacyl-[acyl-carrier-protein] synthase-3